MDALGSFPVRTLKADTRLFRVHHAGLGPCWFSGFPAGHESAGRFDLLSPRGTSYWALQPEAAFLETVARRPAAVVPLELLDRFRLSSVRLPKPLVAANAPVKRARGFGLTAELHTTTDVGLTRRWATALDAAGHSGLVSFPRHDVTAKLRSVSLFGRGGEHVPPGWGRRLSTEPIPAAVTDAMASWGIRCLPIPFDVETTSAPRRR